MPFFNFGTHSSHGCQAHQQIVVINPRATADNAKAGCSLQRVGTHVWGRFVSAGCGWRSSGWLEANYKLQSRAGLLTTTPAGQNTFSPSPSPPPLSPTLSLVLSFLSLPLATPMSMRVDHFFLFLIVTEIFFSWCHSLLKHPVTKFQGCRSCSLESLLHASPPGWAALQL